MKKKLIIKESSLKLLVKDLLLETEEDRTEKRNSIIKKIFDRFDELGGKPHKTKTEVIMNLNRKPKFTGDAPGFDVTIRFKITVLNEQKGSIKVFINDNENNKTSNSSFDVDNIGGSIRYVLSSSLIKGTILTK